MHWYSRYRYQAKFMTELIHLFVALMGIPMKLLEVFFKKKMGERYFSFGGSMFIAILLAVTPFYLPDARYLSFKETIINYWGWFLFLIAFCYFSFLRYREIRRPVGQFDFTKYSRSSGISHDFFYKIKLNGKVPSIRRVDMYYEPVAALLVGLVLFLIGQEAIGVLIAFCAVCYCLNWAHAYKMGDDLVLDWIDETIVNRDTSETVHTGRPTASGFQFLGELPASDEMRSGLAKHLIGDEEPSEVF